MSCYASSDCALVDDGFVFGIPDFPPPNAGRVRWRLNLQVSFVIDFVDFLHFDLFRNPW
jgi:hypothetical protein